VTGSHAIRGVTSRRTLLAASAVAVLAGCGEDEESEPAPPADVLLQSLAAERALAAATSSGQRMLRRVSSRARERAERLAAAVSAEGGRPHDAPEPAAGDASPGEIVSRGRAALAAHVAALPSLEGAELRGLAADLVSGAAADVAVLGTVLGVPVADAFPGTSA
jgi:hypothetical protein